MESKHLSGNNKWYALPALLSNGKWINMAFLSGGTNACSTLGMMISQTAYPLWLVFSTSFYQVIDIVDNGEYQVAKYFY